MGKQLSIDIDFVTVGKGGAVVFGATLVRTIMFEFLVESQFTYDLFDDKFELACLACHEFKPPTACF